MVSIYEINDEYMGTVFEVSYYDWVIKISGIVGDVFLLLGVGYKKIEPSTGIESTSISGDICLHYQ
jgi:hypothetical protein